MTEIMDAVAALQRGDREVARRQLLRLWEMLHTVGSPLQRCTITHFLADTEECVAQELAWDLLALEAATCALERCDQDFEQGSLVGFLPSLHLNVGDAYRRLGEPDLADRHARIGLSHVDRLAEDGYGALVRSGLVRLAERLRRDGPRARPE